MPVPVEMKIESVTGSLKDKMPVRPVDLHDSARSQIGEIGQVVGEKAALHAIDAQVKAITAGRRRDGIGARLLLALRIGGHSRDKLSGDERKTIQFIDDKIEVVALGDFGDANLAFETRRIKLTFQANTPRQKRWSPIQGCGALSQNIKRNVASGAGRIVRTPWSASL